MRSYAQPAKFYPLNGICTRTAYAGHRRCLHRLEKSPRVSVLLPLSILFTASDVGTGSAAEPLSFHHLRTGSGLSFSPLVRIRITSPQRTNPQSPVPLLLHQ